MASFNPLSRQEREYYAAKWNETFPYPHSGFNVGVSAGAATTSGIDCEVSGVYGVKADYPFFAMPGADGVFDTPTIDLTQSGIMVDAHELGIFHLEAEANQIGIRPTDAVQMHVRWKKLGRHFI